KRKAPLARGFYISTISKRLQAAVSRQVLGDHGRAVSRGAARSRVDTHDGLLAAGPHHVAVAGRGGRAANGRTDVQAQAVDVRVRLERGRARIRDPDGAVRHGDTRDVLAGRVGVHAQRAGRGRRADRGRPAAVLRVELGNARLDGAGEIQAFCDL